MSVAEQDYGGQGARALIPLGEMTGMRSSSMRYFYLPFLLNTSTMHLEDSLEWRKAQKGQLYRSFVPELLAAQDRCRRACEAFNDNKDPTRRKQVELWRR